MRLNKMCCNLFVRSILGVQVRLEKVLLDLLAVIAKPKEPTVTAAAP